MKRNRVKRNRVLGWSLIAVGLLMIIVSLMSCVGNSIGVSRDIDALKNRAQVSNSPSKMAELLEQMLVNMEERGFETGYGSLLVKSEWTSIIAIKENINQVLGRLEVVKTMPRESDAWQQAMDDIRGTLRELNLHSYGQWQWNRGGWLWGLGALAGFLLIGGVAIYKFADELFG